MDTIVIPALRGRRKEDKMPEEWLKWENGKEWGTLYCPMLGKEIMTYWPGGPAFYSYTAPFVDDGDVCYYRYDHDEGGWDDTLICMGPYFPGVIIRFSEI